MTPRAISRASSVNTVARVSAGNRHQNRSVDSPGNGKLSWVGRDTLSARK